MKQSNVLNFLKDNRNCDYIAEQEGVGPGVIYAHVRAIKRKGIEIIGIKDKQGRVNNYKVVDPRDLNK